MIDSLLIFDLGSHSLKAGVANIADEARQFEMPNLFKEPALAGFSRLPGTQVLKQGAYKPFAENESKSVGMDVLKRQTQISVKYLMELGGSGSVAIQDFDSVSTLLHRLTKKLLKKSSAGSDSLSFVFTESQGQEKFSRKQKVKLCELVFEDFGVDEFQFAQTPNNIALSHGLSTCLTVDCGELNCEAQAICMDNLVPESYLNLGGVAGRHLKDETMYEFANETGSYFQKSSQQEFVVRDIKESCCFALPFQGAPLDQIEPISYKLPSRQDLTIGPKTLTGACELLFRGQGEDSSIGGGIAHMIYKSIQASPLDSQQTLASNILLAGGSTCFPGFEERLLWELNQLHANNPEKANSQPLNFKVSEMGLPQERKASIRMEKNWGGAQVASFYMQNEDCFISKQDYQEYGAEGCLS